MLALHLSKVLCELLREEGISRAFLTSGGSEATDSSMKMARHIWAVRGKPSKTRFVSFAVSYHGASYGASSLNHAKISRRHLGPFLDGFSLPHVDFFRCPESSSREEYARAVLQRACACRGVRAHARARCCAMACVRVLC